MDKNADNNGEAPLNLPPYTYKLREENGCLCIRDDIRRKFVVLTPEEWVRQHFVHYLSEELGYPPALIANECEISVGRVRKRCDSIIYDRHLNPLAILEYKAPDVPLSQQVVEQILRYNYTCRVPYLILSNGLTHLAYRINYGDNRVERLIAIPTYEELSVDRADTPCTNITR